MINKKIIEFIKLFGRQMPVDSRLTDMMVVKFLNTIEYNKQAKNAFKAMSDAPNNYSMMWSAMMVGVLITKLSDKEMDNMLSEFRKAVEENDSPYENPLN